MQAQQPNPFAAQQFPLNAYNHEGMLAQNQGPLMLPAMMAQAFNQSMHGPPNHNHNQNYGHDNWW